MFQFSSGTLYGLVTSNGVVLAAPRKFGALQDVSVDISFNKKTLYGQNQFGIAIARGQGKITGKAKSANLNGQMLNDLFFGASSFSTASIMPIFGEPGVVSGGSFQVTVANGANFQDDLGVFDSITGLPLTRVPNAPATGQYSVSALGVYTFAAADTGKGVLIDYTFRVATTGFTATISQQLSGTTPIFGMVLAAKYNAKPLYLKLNQCTTDKLSMATKMDDFMIPEFDFEAIADGPNGNVGTLALGE